MSPVQAMDRSYATLKQMLRAGAFAPGFRLEANRLAGDLGVSMTPVRDVLHRLVGERLVEANSGEGFHVPTFTEESLRDLYEWNAALLSIAARTARSTDPANHPGSIPPLWEIAAGADRVAALFVRLGAASPNREIGSAIVSANDRLHPFRLIEPDVLESIDGELEAIVLHSPGQAQAIRRYHLRRMRAVPALLRARREGWPGPARL